MLRGTGKSGKELATAGYWTIRGRCGLLPASLVPLGRCELRNALEEDQRDSPASSRRQMSCTCAGPKGEAGPAKGPACLSSSHPAGDKARPFPPEVQVLQHLQQLMKTT